MIYRRVVIITLMLFVILLYIFSDTYAAFLILMLTILLFTFSIVLSLFVKNKVMIQAGNKKSMYKTQEEIFYVHITNDSVLPINRMKCHVKVHNLLVNQSYEQDLFVSVAGKSNNDIPLLIKSEYVGELNISVEKLHLYDLLGFFSFTRVIETQGSITVMPRAFPIELIENNLHLDVIEDEYNVGNAKGINSQEIIGMKEYEATDSFKQIHWKLSSKLDQLIVKEVAEPLESSYSIVIETSLVIDYPSKIDAMIESAYSLSQSLLSQGKKHHIYWADQQEQYLRSYEIYSLEELNQQLKQMLSIHFSTSQQSSISAYLQLEQEVMQSNVFYITINTSKIKWKANTNVNIITCQCVLDKSKNEKTDGNNVITFTPQTMQEDLRRMLY